jgi:hypothetical protein
MAENILDEAPPVFKFTISAQPGTDLAVSFSKTSTGDIVINAFSCACFNADPRYTTYFRAWI